MGRRRCGIRRNTYGETRRAGCYKAAPAENRQGAALLALPIRAVRVNLTAHKLSPLHTGQGIGGAIRLSTTGLNAMPFARFIKASGHMRDVDYTATVAFLRKFFAHTEGQSRA